MQSRLPLHGWTPRLHWVTGQPLPAAVSLAMLVVTEQASNSQQQTL